MIVQQHIRISVRCFRWVKRRHASFWSRRTGSWLLKGLGLRFGFSICSFLAVIYKKVESVLLIIIAIFHITIQYIPNTHLL